MKQGRFSEKQIIAVLREHEAGALWALGFSSPACIVLAFVTALQLAPLVPCVCFRFVLPPPFLGILALPPPDKHALDNPYGQPGQQQNAANLHNFHFLLRTATATVFQVARIFPTRARLGHPPDGCARDTARASTSRRRRTRRGYAARRGLYRGPHSREDRVRSSS
jgi:hypothetical protein